MTKTKQNFSIYQGEDKTLQVTVYDEDDVALNIAGADFLWAVYDGSASKYSRNSTTGASIVAASAGRVNITIPASAMISWTPGSYYHELKMQSSASVLSLLLTGNITLNLSRTSACVP